MKQLILWFLVAMIPLFCACSSESPNVISKGISLKDASAVLDVSRVLPSNFEHLDANKEGYSHEDLGLSKQASEVELFSSGEPFQIIYSYFAIYEKRTQQNDIDVLMKDDQQAQYFYQESIKELASKEGLDVTVSDVKVTHPEIGDLALLTEGSTTTHGTISCFDSLTFKLNNVYVFVYSIYYSSDRLSLIPIAQEIEQHITNFTQ